MKGEEATSMDSSDQSDMRPGFHLWLLVITVVAVVLRVRHLGAQIISGDEIHLLVVVTTRSFFEIPGTVTGFDYCVPLAMFFRGLSEWIPLTEIMFRMPMLICGCLSPALAAILFRRYVSTNIALTAACVIAVHPLFIFYSRFIRPYAICLALLLVVLLLLDRWLKERRRGPLVWAVLLSALACWFQPIALITVGLFFAGLLLYELPIFRAEKPDGTVDKGRPVTVVVAGVSVVLITVLLLSPSLKEFYERMILEKVGPGNVVAEIIEINAAALAGLPGTVPYFLFIALILMGIPVLAWQLRRRSLPLIAALIGQPLVIAALQPSLIDLPLVLARYHFYVLPIAVFAACAAVAGIGSTCCRIFLRLKSPQDPLGQLGCACAVIASAAWIIWGPYSSIYTENRAYAHHYMYQTFQHSENPFWLAAHNHADRIPLHPCYKEIYQSRESIPLVLEWPPPMDYTKMTYHVAQAYHTLPLKVIAQPEEPWWSGPRLNLQNVISFTTLDSSPDLESGTIILLHKNPTGETMHYALGSTQLPPASHHHKAQYDEIQYQVSQTVGPPTFEDDYITLFKVP